MKTYLLIAWLGWATVQAAEPVPAVSTLDLAGKVLSKGLVEADLRTYQGTLLLHGMSEFALATRDRDLTEKAVHIYCRFASGELVTAGQFISYQTGGGGAGLFHLRGVPGMPREYVADAARRMAAQQRRSPEGLHIRNDAKPGAHQVFIDTAFAVTPFMLYAGLAEQREDYVKLAIFQTLELYRILHDEATGLVHQGRGFQGRGVISEDCWSRGNGWGALSLAALCRDLPKSHPKRAEVEAVARGFFAAVLRHQNAEGLWHQEMTDPTSYVETSGSALLLFGLGVAVETGLIDPSVKENIARGLAGLTAYIAEDGSVSHTCIGCLCPGEGKKGDYKRRLWEYNDSHAFGAVVLAYAQGLNLGITEVKPLMTPGCFANPADNPGEPRTAVRHESERSQNIAWENDRIAFRVYGPTVRDRVGSGIDVWAKSMEFPIIEKWYRLNAAGFDYHVDRGEGADFYDVGRLRGCGGSAVWMNGRPFVPETCSTHHIVTDTKDEIALRLEFDPWDADGLQVSEQRIIRMVREINFLK